MASGASGTTKRLLLVEESPPDRHEDATKREARDANPRKSGANAGA